MSEIIFTKRAKVKTTILALSMLIGLSATAAETKTLVCLMGDIAHMDIVISSNDKGSEKIQVKLYVGMNDDLAPVIYENSQSGQSLKSGSIDVIVSTSNLEDIFGGAYLSAGLLKMTERKEKGRYDVLFAAQNTVYTANCGEVK